jgi:hypothetical protein
MGAAQLAAIERLEIVGGDWINRQVGGRAMLYLIPTSRGLSFLMLTRQAFAVDCAGRKLIFM